MIDLKPRTLTPEEVKTFRDYASMIKNEIVRRDASGEFVSTSGDSVDLVSTASTSSMISMEEMYGPDWDE